MEDGRDEKENIAQYQISDEWNYLIEDCKAIISQRVKNSRREIILAYAEVGNRIAEDPLYKKYGKGNQKFLSSLFGEMEISESSGYYAIEFYEKFIKKYMLNSEDVSNALDRSMGENFIDEGENISWHKICNKYLPEPKGNETGLPTPQYVECPKCHYKFTIN
ncbi:hypothetical protein ES695_12660 [Candidatus Atribacteria bacterium 1244-E10-H5-B2]|nr:MAG: hypothetical protein ES695_12660 [Candidatus Atribacteria bacterium 1244-E10-H5-B2]